MAQNQGNQNQGSQRGGNQDMDQQKNQGQNQNPQRGQGGQGQDASRQPSNPGGPGQAGQGGSNQSDRDLQRGSRSDEGRSGSQSGREQPDSEPRLVAVGSRRPEVTGRRPRKAGLRAGFFLVGHC